MGGTPAAARELELRHPGGVTTVVLGDGALAAAAERLADWTAGRALFVVSTPRVLALHGGALEALGRAPARLQVLEVDEGEEAKTLATAERLWRAMLAGGGKRDSRLVAFGGGSATDLGAFVAGCFLRGIGCALLPTTLLAQADAAIGGKSALDLPEGKNSVGLFHHPDLVVGDAAWLRTLPAGELRSGLFEIVKMAAVLDATLLDELEGRLDDLLAGDLGALGAAAAAGAAVEARVVAADPEEHGERRLLNFGHTLGHAIESALGYRGLRHGEAVGYGMLFALRLAARRGLAAADGRRLRDLLRRMGLPPLPALAGDDLVARLQRDKKAREDGLVWVLPRAAGAGSLARDVTVDEVRLELPPFLADPFAV
jgi:3-dehydroquinate synthase